MLSGHSKENSVGGITVNSENNKENALEDWLANL